MSPSPPCFTRFPVLLRRCLFSCYINDLVLYFLLSGCSRFPDLRYPGVTQSVPQEGQHAEADEPRIKFSDRALRALPRPPLASARSTPTRKLTGLRLRVSSTGVKTFTLLRRTKNGPMERLTLGRFDDMKCEQARTEALKLIGDIADGANPAEVKRAHKGEPTFAELFKEYLERHAKPRKRTWREDDQKYRDYLARPLGRKKVSRIARRI